MKKTSLHFTIFLRILFILVATSISALAFSQTKDSLVSNHQMTPKEGFYYLTKVNNYRPDANAVIGSPPIVNIHISWLDLFCIMFDNTNYELYRKNEFKWPAYKKKIIDEIDRGVNSADFNRLFYCITSVHLGKYNFELNGFPIDDMWKIEYKDDYGRSRYKWRTVILAEHNFGNYNVLKILLEPVMSNVWLGKKGTTILLKMNPKDAEKLVESSGDNRMIQAKLIYRVIENRTNNTNMNNTWDRKYLWIWVYKIVFMKGNQVLGEISSSYMSPKDTKALFGQ